MCFVMIIFHPRLPNVTRCCCFGGQRRYPLRYSIRAYSYSHNIPCLQCTPLIQFGLGISIFGVFRRTVQKRSIYFDVIAVFVGHYMPTTIRSTLYCCTHNCCYYYYYNLLLPLLLWCIVQRPTQRLPFYHCTFYHCTFTFFL